MEKKLVSFPIISSYKLLELYASGNFIKLIQYTFLPPVIIIAILKILCCTLFSYSVDILLINYKIRHVKSAKNKPATDLLPGMKNRPTVL